jgi:hypothetical protein
MLDRKQILSANMHAVTLSSEIEEYVKSHLFNGFKLTTKLDWSKKRISSRGGIYKDGPGINISMINAFPNNLGTTVYRFCEYPSYDSDKVIGGFYSRNPYDKLRAIVAHEVAHAVQMYSYRVLNIRCAPHGPIFKKYYAIFREQFVNSSKSLENQVELKSEYESYIAALKHKQYLPTA